MPVITVAQAVELLHEGNLSGRAVAVGGYFAQYFPSCPFAGGYRGPFSDFCRMVAFTDSREASTLCHPWGASGSECSWAPDGVSNLGPFFMSETSGEQSLSALYQQLPVRLVVIGHSGDARQWQCSPDKRGGCGFAFVADRVAWVDGHDVPIGAPATIDAMTGTPIQPAMSLAEVARALGVGEELLTGAPFQAKDVWTIDPRWNLVGDNLVWFVRSITAEESAADPTRPEMVWLVDDETGELLAQHDLALAADYGPARIWVNALLHGIECCPGTEPRPYYSVESSGALVHESMVSGGASGSQNVTTFGPDTPLLLDPGTYTVTSWLATYDGGVIGEPTQECSIEITLRALDDVGLHADFPLNRPCTFASGALPSPF
jgi:hypothetical protein